MKVWNIVYLGILLLRILVFASWISTRQNGVSMPWDTIDIFEVVERSLEGRKVVMTFVKLKNPLCLILSSQSAPLQIGNAFNGHQLVY